MRFWFTHKPKRVPRVLVIPPDKIERFYQAKSGYIAGGTNLDKFLLWRFIMTDLFPNVDMLDSSWRIDTTKVMAPVIWEVME